jgi:hypothetical protein
MAAASGLLGGRSRQRAAVAAVLGILAGCLTWSNRPRDVHSDWDEIWYTSRAFLHSENPYAVGDSLYQAGWEYPLIYPGTAIVLAVPLALTPLRVAQALWNGLGAAGLVWVLTARGWWGLIALASAPFLQAFSFVQWSPMLLSGLAAPALGLIWSAKPTIGAALFAGWPSKPALLGGAALLFLSLLLIPGWPAAMQAGLKTAPHILPLVARPGGVLLLLALLRWRRPEARMLAALALVPQTTAPYEMLPLFLIPRSGRQMAWLTLLTQVAYLLVFEFRTGYSNRDLTPTIIRQWPIWLALIYFPALAMVLWRPAEPASNRPAAPPG